MANSFVSLPLIPRLWASGGSTQSPIPENATGSNRASYQEGFPAITSQPITDDPQTTGLPPNRLDFNGMGTIFTSYAYAMQEGWIPTYDSTVSSKIGGYPKGAILWIMSNGVPQYAVRSTVANNTNNPSSNMTGWEIATINPKGAQMTGTFSNQNSAQIRNIEIVSSEPATGTNGTIYCIAE